MEFFVLNLQYHLISTLITNAYLQRHDSSFLKLAVYVLEITEILSISSIGIS